MNLLDIITRCYGKLHNYKGVPYWFLTPLRKIIRSFSNKVLPKYLSKSITVSIKSQADIIVSLTSFPARINNVWQVIECMKRQTLQPKEVLLWLSKDQFPTSDTIPDSLRSREGDFFKIRMVEGDIRSHKKYYYVSQEYPNDYVFLIDDDIYYPTTILEKTWISHLKNSNAVICNYGCHIGYNVDGSLKSYNDWESVYDYSVGDGLFFGSGGGTLFKPAEMFTDLTNIKLALRLTPTADDVWLNMMAKKGGLKIVLQKNGLILPIANKDNVALFTENVGLSQNDVQIKSVCEYYNQLI